MVEATHERWWFIQVHWSKSIKIFKFKQTFLGLANSFCLESGSVVENDHIWCLQQWNGSLLRVYRNGVQVFIFRSLFTLFYSVFATFYHKRNFIIIDIADTHFFRQFSLIPYETLFKHFKWSLSIQKFNHIWFGICDIIKMLLMIKLVSPSKTKRLSIFE